MSATSTTTIALDSLTPATTPPAASVRSSSPPPPVHADSSNPRASTVAGASIGHSTAATRTDPPPAQPSTSSSASASPNAVTTVDQSLLGCWKTKVKKQRLKPKTVLEITVAIFGLFGVIWTVFIGLPSLKLQKWSAGNDFLQACLSLDSPSTRSTKCNDTVDAGPLPPPAWKRVLYSTSGTIFQQSPARFSAAVVFTIGVLVFATLYFRPRMEPFRPVISMARSDAFVPVHGWRKQTRSQGTLSSPTMVTTWSLTENSGPSTGVLCSIVTQSYHHAGGHGNSVEANDVDEGFDSGSEDD